MTSRLSHKCVSPAFAESHINTSTGLSIATIDCKLDSFATITSIVNLDPSSGNVNVAHPDLGYETPLILARSFDGYIGWYANPRFNPLPPFDEVDLLFFNNSEYLCRLGNSDSHPPPRITKDDLAFFVRHLWDIIRRLGSARYCVPPFNEDDTGRYLIELIQVSCLGEFLVLPESASMTGVEHVVGFDDTEKSIISISEISVTVVTHNGEYYMRLNDPFLPIFFGIAR